MTDLDKLERKVRMIAAKQATRDAIGGGGGGSGSGDMLASTYDPAGVSEQLVGRTPIQTLTNKTLTSPTLTTPPLGTPPSGVMTNVTGVVEAGITLADNTTNNSSTSNHGFLLKLDNTATNFMNGTGAWSVPAGTGMTEAEFNPNNISEQLVGLTATQTLTNKTIDEAVISGTPDAAAEIGYDTTQNTLNSFNSNTGLGTLSRCVYVNGNVNESKGSDTSHVQTYTTLYSIPANSLVTGKVFRVHFGYVASLTSLSTAVQVTFQIGGTTVWDFGLATDWGASTLTRYVGHSLYIIGNGVGASQSITVLPVSRESNRQATNDHSTTGGVIAGFATNGSLALNPAVNWASASAGETLVLTSFIVEEIN